MSTVKSNILHNMCTNDDTRQRKKERKATQATTSNIAGM